MGTVEIPVNIENSEGNDVTKPESAYSHKVDWVDVPAKAYLGDDDWLEVRRFDLDEATAASLSGLKQKLRDTFPTLRRRQRMPFDVAWRDADDDMISISCDQELQLALADFRRLEEARVLKLYVVGGRGYRVMRWSRGTILGAVTPVIAGLMSHVLHRAVASVLGVGSDSYL